MQWLQFVVLANGLACLCLIGPIMEPVAAKQCVVRRLTLEPGLLANVSIGYPEQPFKLLFNTGSANTWVMAIDRASKLHASTNSYQANSSSTHLEDGRPWETHLAVGALIEGQLAKETFGLAGAFVSDQLFAQILEAKGWMVDYIDFDGALGLGSSRALSLDIMDPIQTMYRQQLIPEQMFSLHVSKNQQDEVVGTAVLGGVDEAHFKGQINYVSIIYRWTFLLDYVTVSNLNHVKHSIRSRASIDSTSNLVLAPKAIVDLAKTLFGVYEEPRTRMARWRSCNDVPNDEDTSIDLVIGGTNMTLSAGDLLIKLEHRGEHICYMALQAHPERTWTLGTPFLRKYYTVFDYHHKRVGFAASA